MTSASLRRSIQGDNDDGAKRISKSPRQRRAVANFGSSRMPQTFHGFGRIAQSSRSARFAACRGIAQLAERLTERGQTPRLVRFQVRVAVRQLLLDYYVSVATSIRSTNRRTALTASSTVAASSR